MQLHKPADGLFINLDYAAMVEKKADGTTDILIAGGITRTVSGPQADRFLRDLDHIVATRAAAECESPAPPPAQPGAIDHRTTSELRVVRTVTAQAAERPAGSM